MIYFSFLCRNFDLQEYFSPWRVWGGGGELDISLGGEVRPGPHTLTLFKTKIADFLTLFKTEFRFLIPCLRHLTRNPQKIFAEV